MSSRDHHTKSEKQSISTMFQTPTKAGYNDSIDDTALFYTPLQRLKDKPINDAHIGADFPRKREEHPQADELIPLAQIPLRLSQTKLLDKAKTDNLFNRSGTKKAIYYKAPSSSVDDQFGVKEFLPPAIEKKKYPLIYRETDAEVQVEGEASAAEASPTGEWTNPVIMAALRRQVNKEYEVKRMLKLMLAIGLVKLTSDVVAYKVNTKRAEYAILAVILVNILSCVYRLLEGQDQCKDLPLSDRQRELIGLRPLGTDVLKTASKPKYSKFTKKPNTAKPDPVDQMIELSYRRPAPTQVHREVYERSEASDRIFRRNLDLKLNVQ